MTGVQTCALPICVRLQIGILAGFVSEWWPASNRNTWPDSSESAALSEAVIEFHKTGQNPYNLDGKAVGEGKDLYTSICQSCHMPDGSGRIGPSLIDGRHQYPQIVTDVGLFEVVFGGASGAMQPFSKRLSQDQILKVITYVRTSFIGK